MLPRDAILTALAFETTGSFRGIKSLPWQLGLAEAAGGECSRSESLFLRVPADYRFNPYTPGRWAEKRDILNNAPTLPSCWPKLRGWLEGRWLVSHNAPVERTILREAFPMHSFPCWIDTLRLCRAAIPRLPDYSLEALLKTLGLQEKTEAACPGLAPHDALYDAVGCLNILLHILQFDGWRDVTCEYLAGL